MLLLYVAAGRWIGDIAEEAVAERSHLDEDVMFVFNDIQMVVTASDTRASVVDRYDVLLALCRQPTPKRIM